MKLAIVDDHVLFREGLAAIIGAEAGIELVGLAGSVQEAVALAREAHPEIILMDFNLQDGTGVDATRQILSEQPDCKIVFLTIYEDDESLFEAIRSGAKGFLLKSMRPQKLLAAIRSVGAGEAALSRTMTARLMDELARTKDQPKLPDASLQKLSAREREVFSLLAGGANNQEIAQHLFLSENTVKHHIHSVYEKLGLSDRRDAIRFAREHGIGLENS
jgi:DNA-binding NarL/FixJ family response regulator